MRINYRNHYSAETAEQAFVALQEQAWREHPESCLTGTIREARDFEMVMPEAGETPAACWERRYQDKEYWRNYRGTLAACLDGGEDPEQPGLRIFYFVGSAPITDRTPIATFDASCTAATAQAAFDKLVAQAKRKHGTGGCTGTIAEKRAFLMVERLPDETTLQLELRYAQDHLHFSHDHDAPAACVDLGPAPKRPGMRRFYFFGIARGPSWEEIQRKVDAMNAAYQASMAYGR